VISGDRIEPFRALVYNADKAGDCSELVAPPYDLIGPQRQQQLYDRSPFNVVRLEYGKEQDRYAAAAETMRKWQSERILQRVATPALYFYSQFFDYEGRHLRRDGFILRLRLEAFAPGRILPHERTFAAAKQDRLRLLEATRTNLSPIFGLHSGAHRELDALRESLRSRPALMRVTDDLKIDNELRMVESPAEIKIVRDALRDSRILIADGHHRYETALDYQRQCRAAEIYRLGLRPYDYVMISLVPCDDPGLVILPTHRVVQRLDSERIRKFEARAGESFSIENFGDRDSMRRALASAGRGSTGVLLRGQSRPKLLRLKRADLTKEAMPDQRTEVRELDVSILHGLVFEKILGLRDFDVRAGGNIEYTIDSEAAFDSVAQGRADGAFFLNPPSILDVERVSDAGATMPEKSTYFFPKLLTGLVMNPLCD